jgi:hypothetical protein
LDEMRKDKKRKLLNIKTLKQNNPTLGGWKLSFYDRKKYNHGLRYKTSFDATVVSMIQL